MKPGVNPVWKIVSNNEHVSIIDFVIVPIWGLLLFYRNIYNATTVWVAHTCYSAIQWTVSYLRLIVFPAPNACTCNAVKIPIVSLKCWEKSYISCRPKRMGWRKYLNCWDAFTRCWHTDIHLLYFCIPDFIIWGLGSKVKSSIWNSGFIHCIYHTGWTALAMIVTICGTYAPFCMRMASLFFKVKAQRHSLYIVVFVRKDTLWSVQLGLPISIHILILN